MQQCITELIEKIEDVVKEHVETDVYDVGTSVGRENYYDDSGEPTGQLRDSIKVEVIQEGMDVFFDIKNDPSIMDFDPDTFLHGSDYYSPADVRSFLGNILNDGTSGGLFGGRWQGLKRPYLTNADEELKRKIPQWWKEALRKRGLDVK